MPTNILPMTCRPEYFSKISRKTRDGEVKSGFLVFLGPGVRRDVRVVVHRTSLEHFAVIYPRKRLSKPVGVVNLRNTVMERAEAGFVVRQKGYENTISARFLCSDREVDSWVVAFTSSSSQNINNCLPVLMEAEEN